MGQQHSILQAERDETEYRYLADAVLTSQRGYPSDVERHRSYSYGNEGANPAVYPSFDSPEHSPYGRVESRPYRQEMDSDYPHFESYGYHRPRGTHSDDLFAFCPSSEDYFIFHRPLALEVSPSSLWCCTWTANYPIRTDFAAICF